MIEKEKKAEQYISMLEEELLASIERENRLAEEDLSFRKFATNKFKKTKLYTNVISDPNSKAGKIARLPRSIYRLVKNPEVRNSLLQKKTVNDVLIRDAEDWYFLDPWEVSLQKREKAARQISKDGGRLALYFVDKADSSTFRYRCYNTFEITAESKKWRAVYFLKGEIETVEKLLPKVGVLIFGRQSGQGKNVEKLVKLAHENKIKVGLDIDDLVFDTKYLNLMLDTIGEKSNRSYWLAYFMDVKSMAERMDFYITTNNFLSEKLKESFGRPCKVIRNSLNSEQITASRVYREVKTQGDERKFIMGYFSGSPTHAKDFAVAEPELIKFLRNHDDAVLHVVGYMRFSGEAEKLIEQEKIRFLPFTDFRKLQRLMAEVNVNIAPLVINDFTNCKSELKFFEAAVVETTTIASPTYTFEKAITDGKNGFLAQPGEWYDKLEYLYKHPEENRKIAKEAKKYAMKHYYGKELLKEVESAYDFFAK